MSPLELSKQKILEKVAEDAIREDQKKKLSNTLAEYELTKALKPLREESVLRALQPLSRSLPLNLSNVTSAPLDLTKSVQELQTLGELEKSALLRSFHGEDYENLLDAVRTFKRKPEEVKTKDTDTMTVVTQKYVLGTNLGSMVGEDNSDLVNRVVYTHT